MNLVTGATGIIGSHVALQLLLSGREVVAARQKNSDLSKMERLFAWYSADHKALLARLKWVDMDILDVFSIEDALEGISHVYHCAGFVSFSRAHRKKLFAINEQGTRNMVNACLHKNIGALCHVSTIGTINNSEYRPPLDEQVFWKTSGMESDYALSKYNAEREVWRGMEEGLNVVIVNPGVVLSPVFWGQSSSQIFDRCYRGNRFYTGGQSAYVAAMDVARVMVRLVEERHFGQRFILIENNYPLKEILDKVQACLGKPLPTLRVGKGLLRTAGWLQRFRSVFTGKSPVLTKSLIHSVLNTQSFSNNKIRQALGYEFEPIVKTIAKICQFYLEERQKPQSSI